MTKSQTNNPAAFSLTGGLADFTFGLDAGANGIILVPVGNRSPVVQLGA